MVHLRLNDSEANPNPHINFITALPMPDSSETESARQLLRALAAQVKPVMKAHGFTVNSFEEYEYNQVFAGRNWNNGETVELVLRRKDGAFVSPSWLMSTLCHELAHIKHMNHGRDFQALWSQLRNEVRALQTKGYYGDGLWSAGTRLGDSAHIAGSGAEAGDLPEYICGGAQTTSRPSRRRRVRQPRSGPSRRTGAQTAKKRKPGSRVTAAGAFVGEGRALNAHITDEKEKKAGSGFGKRTQSKRAKEERAAAIERRLLALQGKASSKPEPVTEESQGEESSDSDIEVIEVPETDQERRKALDDTLGDADLLGLRSGTLTDFWGDFIVNSSTSAADAGPSKPQHEPEPVPALRQTTLLSGSRSTRDLGVGKMVQEEIRFRKAEALGMESRPKGRMLGAAPDGAFARESERSHQASSPSQIASSIGSGLPRPPSQENPLSMWTCGICTLENEALHLACAACGTIRGEA